MKKFLNFCLVLILIGLFVMSYLGTNYIQDSLQKEDAQKDSSRVQQNLTAVPPQIPKKIKKYDLSPISPSEYKKYGISTVSREQMPRTRSEYNFYVENSLEQNNFWEKESSKSMLEGLKKDLDSQKFLERYKQVNEIILEIETKLKDNPPDKDALEIQLQSLYFAQAFSSAVGKKLGVGL